MLTWEAHTGAVTSLAFVPGGGLLSIGSDATLRYWNHLTATEEFDYTFREWTVASPEWSHNPHEVLADRTGRYAAVGNPTHGIQLVSIPDGKIGYAEIQCRFMPAMILHPCGGTFLAVGQLESSPIYPPSDRDVFEVRFSDGEIIAQGEDRVEEHPGFPCRIAIHPAGTQLIAGRSRYEWPSGKIIGRNDLARSSIFAVSHDGDKLFGRQGSRLLVWGFQLGTMRRKIGGHFDAITGFAMTPDGTKLWTASADARVRQWDVDSYRCTQCYGLKIGPLRCVAVSPDGLTAAAGSSHNGMIAVWDLD